MTRFSPYFPLAWRVDVQQPPCAAFETMAAFNHPRVALGYAADCRKAHNGSNVYRVMARTSRGWRLMTKED